MSIDRDHLIVSSCHAFIGAIPKKLRGLTVKEEYNALYWKAYFDDQPNEREKSVLSQAISRIAAGFPEVQHVHEEYIFLPASFRIEMLDYWVFLRWEENL